jgi:glycosyltransferase involved in cell wall biosynthesis
MNDDTHPLVTVITPTYNRAGDYLAETIESVLAQDYPNFEYIVLDDGSTDHTPRLLEEYGDRIIRERHENMGEIGTVNKGFRMARGEYIAVVNSDDPVLPGWLSTAVDFMQDHPEALIGYPDWVMIDENSQPIRNIQVYEYSFVDMVRWSHCLPGPGALRRRRSVELASGYNPEFAHMPDHEYYLRLAFHGLFARIPHTLASYRQHEGTISRGQRSTAMAAERIRMVDNLFAQPDLPAEVRAVRRQAYAAAYYISGMQCEHNNPAAARRYFLKSLAAHPFKCQPNGVPRSLYPLFKTILPGGIVDALWKLKRAVRGSSPHRVGNGQP